MPPQLNFSKDSNRRCMGPWISERRILAVKLVSYVYANSILKLALWTQSAALHHRLEIPDFPEEPLKFFRALKFFLLWAASKGQVDSSCQKNSRELPSWVSWKSNSTASPNVHLSNFIKPTFSQLFAVFQYLFVHQELNSWILLAVWPKNSFGQSNLLNRIAEKIS